MKRFYFFVFTILFIFFLKKQILNAHEIDTNKINSIIEIFIKNNPKMIRETLDKFKLKEVSDNLKNNLISLSKIPNPKLSRTNSDITVYEFFDYNCGYCKLVMESLFDVYEIDKKVEIVFVEFPILSKSSLRAALFALAATSITNQLNMDLKKLKKDMSDKNLHTIIKNNRFIANELKIQGTPAFIIGNKIYPGAINKNEIIEAIKIGRRNIK